MQNTTMAFGNEFPVRGSSYGQPLATTCLEDRFELIKEIGDGSFGSVALARVRTAGAHVARRGTLVNPGIYPYQRHQTNLPLGCDQDNEKDV